MTARGYSPSSHPSDAPRYWSSARESPQVRPRAAYHSSARTRVLAMRLTEKSAWKPKVTITNRVLMG